MRISKKDLEIIVNQINKITGNSLEYMTDKKINVGHYHISSAYGGHQLVQTDNEHGGERSITYGYSSTREFYNLLYAYLNGLRANKDIEDNN